MILVSYRVYAPPPLDEVLGKQTPMRLLTLLQKSMRAQPVIPVKKDEHAWTRGRESTCGCTLLRPLLILTDARFRRHKPDTPSISCTPNATARSCTSTLQAPHNQGLSETPSAPFPFTKSQERQGLAPRGYSARGASGPSGVPAPTSAPCASRRGLVALAACQQETTELVQLVLAALASDQSCLTRHRSEHVDFKNTPVWAGAQKQPQRAPSQRRRAQPASALRSSRLKQAASACLVL